MDWMEIFYKIFELCILPLLGILTFYLVQLIKVKAAEFAAKCENDTLDKYILMAADTISACVIATNQTYVEGLKAKGEFDMLAQKQAFQMTYEAVVSILSDEAKKYLTEAYGDLTAYLTNMIEAEVNANK